MAENQKSVQEKINEKAKTDKYCESNSPEPTPSGALLFYKV